MPLQHAHYSIYKRTPHIETSIGGGDSKVVVPGIHPSLVDPRERGGGVKQTMISLDQIQQNRVRPSALHNRPPFKMLSTFVTKFADALGGEMHNEAHYANCGLLFVIKLSDESRLRQVHSPECPNGHNMAPNTKDETCAGRHENEVRAVFWR